MQSRYLLAPALALALAPSVHAQPIQGGIGPSSSPLYRNDAVSRALKLTDDQVTRLNTLTGRMQTRFREDFDRAGRLPERERENRIRELNTRLSTEWMTGARDVFNENQLARYRQLQYQYGGFNTFLEPDVQKRLTLTEAQQKALRENLDWSNQQIQEAYRQGATDRERGLRMYNDYRKAYEDRMTKFLTEPQLKTWREMTGDPFTFPPTFPTPPRP